VDETAQPGRPQAPVSRLRQVVMILVFDLGGPLLTYSLLRSAGVASVIALVVSGVPPALGIAIGALAAPAASTEPPPAP
jgi:hypothetical protein